MKILVFPKDKNPYQNLLYQNMTIESISYLTQEIDTNLFLGLVKIPFELILKRRKGYTVFHLHWLNKFHTHTFDSFLSRIFFFIYTIAFLMEIKMLGYKLVWTVHNILPHETQTINDKFILYLLCKLADKKIVHSVHSINELKKYKVDTDRISIIPIGNYMQLYENSISKNKARDTLGIPKDTFVFSYFGLIKKYKGIDKLVSSFITIHEYNKNITLIIAGKCDDKEIENYLNNIQNKYNKSIYTYIKYIPDKNVQLFFNAANIMVFPFKKITTSSSTILASSFGKAFIYPKLGNLIDLPQDLGFSYDPTDIDGLKNSMLNAINQKTKLSIINKNNLIYAKSHSWGMISTKTLTLYRSLFASKINKATQK